MSCHHLTQRPTLSSTGIRSYSSHLMPSPKHLSSNRSPSLLLAAVCWFVGTGLAVLGLEMVLEQDFTAATFISNSLWQKTVSALGAKVEIIDRENSSANIELTSLFAVGLVASGICWLVGAFVISFRSRQPVSTCLARWGVSGWLWSG